MEKDLSLSYLQVKNIFEDDINIINDISNNIKEKQIKNFNLNNKKENNFLNFEFSKYREDIKIPYKDYFNLKQGKFSRKNFLKYYPKSIRKLLEKEFDKPFSLEILEQIIHLLKNTVLVREKIISSSEKNYKNKENERKNIEEKYEKKIKKYEGVYDSDFNYKEENTTFLNTNFLNFLKEKKEINTKRKEKIKILQNNPKNSNQSYKLNESNKENLNSNLVIVNNKDKDNDTKKNINEMNFSNLNISFDLNNNNNKYIEKENINYNYNYNYNLNNKNNSNKNFQFNNDIKKDSSNYFMKESSFISDNPFYINNDQISISNFNFDKENQMSLCNDYDLSFDRFSKY